MRRAQGTLVLGAILFVIILFILIGIYIRLLDSITDVGRALRDMYLRESLRARENIDVDLVGAILIISTRYTRFTALLDLINTGSISTRIQYTILACYTGSGIAKAILTASECTFALSPGEARTCTISYRFSTGCSYVTVTFVTALGNSYTVRIG